MSEIKNETTQGGENNNTDTDLDIDVDLDTEADADVDDDNDTAGDKKGNKKTDTETPDAKRARLQRQLKQLDKKYPPAKKDEDTSSKKSVDEEYGQKAFLIASGLKTPKERSLAKEVASATGKSLEDVLESKHFQAELAELRENESSMNAIPKGSKRSNQSQADSVEYWIGKNELPPKDQRELRQKVVNARIQAQKNKNIFTDTPVAGK